MQVLYQKGLILEEFYTLEVSVWEFHTQKRSIVHIQNKPLVLTYGDLKHFVGVRLLIAQGFRGNRR